MFSQSEIRKNRINENIFKRIELEITDRISSHTMRKTFAYQAYQSGIDLSLIQKQLNHSACSVNLAYIGITKDQMMFI